MLRSSRLILRALEPEDTDLMFAIENDSDSWIYGDTIAPLSRRMLREYACTYDANPFKAGQIRLVIADKSDKPVGLIDLYDINQRQSRAFVGIYIIESERGKGYSSEALVILEQYAAFILGLNRLAAKVTADNPPSEALFKKNGYVILARLTKWIKRNNDSYVDLLIMAKNLK